MTLSTLCSGIGLLSLIPLLHYSHWLPNEWKQGAVFSQWVSYLPVVSGHIPLLLTLLIFITLIAAMALLQYAQARVMGSFQQNFLFTVRDCLNKAMVNAEWSFLLGCNRKQLEHMITVGLPQIDALTYISVQMMSTVIVVFCYLVFSMVIAFKLTILVGVITCGLFLLLRKSRMMLLGKQNYRIQQQMQEALSQYLEGVKLAKSYNQTSPYIDYFSRLNREWGTVQKQVLVKRSMTQCLLLVLSAVLFAVMVLGAFYWHLSLFALIGLLIVFARLLPRLSVLQQNYLQVLNLLPVFMEARQMQRVCASHAEFFSEHCSVSFAKTIQLDAITYQYPTHKHLALDEVSLKIHANTTTAIVGVSGAGKSTLADLLLGLLEPTTGKIKIDGSPLTPDKRYAWREFVSYVPQEPYFFNDTLRANLLWAAADATEAMLWEALEKTAAVGFVRQLPQQLDTFIGERGIRLSGGERQRLALARALLRKPKILLLDEATSALDEVNEQAIYQTLKQIQGHVTVIIIAHRYSTIRNADQIIVLNEGRLVEQGAPQDFLNRKEGYFAQLFARQYVSV